MKKINKILWVLIVLSMAVSACQVPDITPPPVENTETDVATIEPGDAEDTIIVPTEILPVVDEDGRMYCSLVEPLFTELTEEQKEQLAIFPEVTDEDWTKGPEDALLTIIEYTDFFCPYCQMAFSEFETLMEKYPEEVRLVYRALPLESLHPTAPLAAHAAEAAGLQGKFWEMYSEIFSNQTDLSSLTEDELTEWLMETAEELELDRDQFAEDLNSEAVVEKISTHILTMFDNGVSSTPTVLINGRPIGDWRASYLTNIIEVLKIEKTLPTECPEFVIDQSKSYTATITTKDGDMVIELYDDVAPLAVNSFVYLARQGFYDGITFHRVYHDFMAQSGDPTGTGWSGAGYQYREEISPDLTFDEPYMLGVAKSSAVASSGSQFFITYVPYPTLNGGYTIFGKLIDGFDVFAKIAERDADNDPTAAAGDVIISISIVEK